MTITTATDDGVIEPTTPIDEDDLAADPKANRDHQDGVVGIEEPTQAEIDTAEAPTPEDQQQLRQMGVSLEWLQDLQYTITQKGVSRADMTAVNNIASGLSELGLEGFETPPVLAMQFTHERTTTNLKVAQESISQTVITTIKQFIRKLIEYIRKMALFARRWYQGEERILNKLKRSQKVIRLFRDETQLFERKFSRPSNDMQKRWRQEVNEKLPLAKTKTGSAVIPANVFGLWALGDGSADKALKEAFRDVKANVQEVITVVSQLQTFLLSEDEQAELTDPDQILSDFWVTEAKLQKLRELSPDSKYVERAVANSQFPDNISLGAITDIYSYDFLLETYDELTKYLQKINRVAQDANVEGITTVIQQISKAVDAINNAASFFYEADSVKVRAMKWIAQYYSACFWELKTYAVQNAVNSTQQDMIESAANKVGESVEKALKGIGI